MLQIRLEATRARLAEELRLWKKEIQQKTDAAKQREGFAKFVAEQQQRQLVQKEREAAQAAEDPAFARSLAGSIVAAQHCCVGAP